jgi:hypothetical protein
MKTLKFSFLMSASLFASVAIADVFVIANSSVQLTGAEVRDVFVGNKQLAGAVKLVPVDNANVQPQFLAKVMKVDVAKYGSIWIKKSFRDGLIPPAMKSGDAEVLDYVKKTVGAVGYVGSAPNGVTVVQKF